jgi:hypothetical protein
MTTSSTDIKFRSSAWVVYFNYSDPYKTKNDIILENLPNTPRCAIRTEEEELWDYEQKYYEIKLKERELVSSEFGRKRLRKELYGPFRWQEIESEYNKCLNLWKIEDNHHCKRHSDESRKKDEIRKNDYEKRRIEHNLFYQQKERAREIKKLKIQATTDARVKSARPYLQLLEECSDVTDLERLLDQYLNVRYSEAYGKSIRKKQLEKWTLNIVKGIIIR